MSTQTSKSSGLNSYHLRSFKGVYPTVGQNVMVDPQATVIGDVTLGDDVSVWPQAVIRGDVNYIRIGQGTNVQDGCVLHVTHQGDYSQTGSPLLIGKQVTIGHNVILHGCQIDDLSLIGMGSTVLDGSRIQSHVMLAANSLVAPNKILESGFLYAGSPAVKRRPLSDKEMAMFAYMSAHYIQLKNDFMEIT